ncbi:C-X-C motif chemokine 10 [Varanus komodoensis]|uniref:C-X-C motif chemokine 10 n=1 Tax=Varanus komodoensis TaxID=61221 RepID=UPI001CF7834E|nr:C-X-C motif chemokine 10 [Varanus komodoensis]
MNRTFAVLLCMMFLLATAVQGQLTSRNGRCVCLKTVPSAMPLQRIGHLESHPISSSCNREEIIVTLKKTQKKVCLDPNSKEVKKMVKKYGEKLEERKRRVPGKLSP